MYKKTLFFLYFLTLNLQISHQQLLNKINPTNNPTLRNNQQLFPTRKIPSEIYNKYNYILDDFTFLPSKSSQQIYKFYENQFPGI